MVARCRGSLFFNEQMKSIQRECRRQQHLPCRHHDDSECKPKHSPNGRRSQCKRNCRLISSRCACRSRTIASAGSIIAVIAASASNHANALSLIDAARATGTPSTRGRCTAGDVETGACAVSTISSSFTTVTSPLDSTPCLGHAASTCMYSSDDALSDGNNNNSNRNGRPRRINYFVVGTSHFRCDSADEVERIIREIGPDGVVIEP